MQHEKTEIEDIEEDTQKDKYLTFKLGNDSFGIEITYVTEIIGLQKITDVPDLPDYVNGIINLRGKIIPVVDVRKRFKKDTINYDERTCIIVVNISDICVGLIVDRVSEVMDIPSADISDPPKLNSSKENRFVKGIGKTGNEVKLILDGEKLLRMEEIEQLSSVNLS